MKKTIDIDPEQRKVLSTIFREFSEIQAVYLFGSAATGDQGPLSDLDLGIFVSDPRANDIKLDLLKRLTEAGFDEIDLVMLNNADLIVQYEAIRPNILLYKTSDFDRGDTFSRITRKYLDIKPYLERQKKRYKRRILDASI